MESSPTPVLSNLLRAVSDDALFLLASTHRLEPDRFVPMAERRSKHYQAIVEGAPLDSTDWSGWLIAMSHALAPVAPPLWLPMHEVAHALTLERGARGVRSLFTSKPSEKQVHRSRTIGSAAIRVLVSVFGADRVLTDDEQMLRRCLIAALGLPDEDERLLGEEEPGPADKLEFPSDVDQKMARLLARGAWAAALHDGLDPREDSAVMVLSGRLNLSPDEVEALRKESRTEFESRKVFGAAAVDAVRYVLSDDPDSGRHLAKMTAMLALPPVHRAEPMAAIQHAGPIVLGRRHALERPQREACLALAWFAALGTDPSQSRIAELAVRHDRVATDLGSRTEGPVCRAAAHTFLHDQLYAAVLARGL